MRVKVFIMETFSSLLDSLLYIVLSPVWPISSKLSYAIWNLWAMFLNLFRRLSKGVSIFRSNIHNDDYTIM